MKNHRGVTLVEFLFMVIIVGILATIAFERFEAVSVALAEAEARLEAREPEQDLLSSRERSIATALLSDNLVESPRIIAWSYSPGDQITTVVLPGEGRDLSVSYSDLFGANLHVSEGPDFGDLLEGPDYDKALWEIEAFFGISYWNN